MPKAPRRQERGGRNAEANEHLAEEAGRIAPRPSPGPSPRCCRICCPQPKSLQTCTVADRSGIGMVLYTPPCCAQASMSARSCPGCGSSAVAYLRRYAAVTASRSLLPSLWPSRLLAVRHARGLSCAQRCQQEALLAIDGVSFRNERRPCLPMMVSRRTSRRRRGKRGKMLPRVAASCTATLHRGRHLKPPRACRRCHAACHRKHVRSS